VAVAARRGGSDDRAAQPAPVEGTPLKALAPLVSCPSAPKQVAAQSDFTKTLAVFRRQQREPDGLAVPSGARATGQAAGLPLAQWSPEDVRTPALGVLPTQVQLVAGVGAPGDPGCAERTSGTTPVVCIVNARPPSSGTRCFGLADVRAGRALALIDPGNGVVAGLVPDGVQQVELHWAGRTAIAQVYENTFEATLPGAAVGTPVGVSFGASSCRSGSPARGLLETVPALTLQSHGDVLPAPIVAQLKRSRGVLTAGARLVTSAHDVRFWVVPSGTTRCADGRVAGTPDRACALAATTRQLYADVCVGAADAGHGSLMFVDRGGGDLVVVGIAPPGTDAAVIPTSKGVAIIPSTEGVVAGFLPPGVTQRETTRLKVTYRRNKTPTADRQTVTVVNASGIAQRDKAVADRLASLARGTAAEGEVQHGIATLPTRAKSVVEFAPNGVDKARRVAGMLGIRTMRPLEQGVPTGGAAVVVIAGSDYRIPFSLGSPG
jgi:hypothetical protein